MEKIALGVNSNIKTVTIGEYFDTTGTEGLILTAPIWVVFIPDLITLKYVCIIMDPNCDVTVYKVQSNLVNGDIVSFLFSAQKIYNGVD